MMANSLTGRATGRGRRSRRTPLVSFLLAITVGLTGCTGTAPAASPAVPQSTQRARIGVDGAIDALAASGVGVYEGPTAAAPIRTPHGASPLRLLRSQVANLARDSDGGGGIGADEIDKLLPMPSGSVPFSFVLAGYVAAAKTPGAKQSRKLMAGQDLEQPASLLFPTIVLALFVAETTAAVSPAATGQPTGAATTKTAAFDRLAIAAARIASMPLPRAGAGVCGNFSAFFADTLQKVAAAIVGVLPDIPFLKAAISWALTKGLQLGLGVAAGLIERIPFIQALRSAVGTLALAVTVVAALRDWTVSVIAQPAMAHYAVGAELGGAKAIGTVDDGPGDVFSPEVRECAKLLGVSLAKGGAAGSAAAWRVVAGSEHATPVINQDTQVDAGKHSTFSLAMTRETEDVHRGKRIANGLVVLRVTVKRQDVEQVRKFVEGAITSALPSGVYAALTGMFGDPLAKIAAMTDVTGQGRLVAEYHLKDEPSASPAPAPSPSGGRAVRVYLDRPAGGQSILAGRVVDLVSCDGPYGTWKGVFRVGGVNAIKEVPFYEIPATFTVGGQDTRNVHVKLEVVNLYFGLGEGVPTSPGLDVTVNGTSMTISQLPDGDPAPFTVPIRPAPDANCP